MRKLLTHLSAAGILTSIQGKYGGYRIAKALDEISMLDILKAVDSHKPINECFFAYANCALNDPCHMHDKWGGLKADFENTLDATTFEDIRQSKTSWKKMT